ncbi:MAG: DNA primase [Lentisphaeria bacterium]|nr:DNA primase [Lentisphaeria bacterium]
MGRIPEWVVEEVRARADVVDIIGSYVSLRRAGNAWTARCPFHNEKTPSFHVNPQRQMYYCFGCGRGGDVFRFVMERENLLFPDAVELLASRVGVVIPEDHSQPGGNAAPNRNIRNRLYALNEEFARFFERTLAQNPDGAAARYLATRQLPPEMIRQFRIGAAPPGWDDCLRYGRGLGFSEDEMVLGGILRRNDESGRIYDHFRDRLTFAIWNERGDVVGFSARSLETKPEYGKYVNTPETPVFKKGQLLYALPFARKAMQEQNCAILCEGQLDTIAMHRAGFPQTMAPQGTGFTADQSRILNRYVDRVLLAFDADNAGQKAIRSALELLLPLEMEVRIIRIPGGKDPDELYRNNGPEAVAGAVHSAVSWIEYLRDTWHHRGGLDSPAEQGRMLADAVSLLLLLENPIQQELYLRETARVLTISEKSLAAEIARQKRQRQRSYAGSGGQNQTAAAAPADPPAPSPAAAPAVPPQMRTAELTLLELALASEELARQIAAAPESEHLPDDTAGRALNAVLAATINGEHAEAGAAAAALLGENPDPDVARCLISGCSYPEKQWKKAAADCLTALREADARRSREKILAELRQASPARQLELLAELEKLDDTGKM